MADSTGIQQDATGVGSNTLSFSMQHQQQGNWCWAAVAASVRNYFQSPPDPLMQQCTVVNHQLSRTDCCATAPPTGCNVRGSLQRALAWVGHLKARQSGTLDIGPISLQINTKCPIGVRISWRGGGAHFVAIVGYSDLPTGQFVDVEDPLYGPSVFRLSAFKTGYKSDGTWTHTFLTK